MAATTITVDARVRDRLREFAAGSKNYSEAITRILDRLEMDDFLEDAKRRIDDPSHPWLTDLKDVFS